MFAALPKAAFGPGVDVGAGPLIVTFEPGVAVGPDGITVADSDKGCAEV